MNVDARWATQQLEAHNASRRRLGFEQHVPPPRTTWDRDELAPPPALVLSDDPSVSASSSPDARVSTGAYSASPSRWAARFNDGKPPPPPPPPPITSRDIVGVMHTLGIDPTDARAQQRLEVMIENGALRDYGDDLYTFIRAQQRVSEKRKLKRARLIPQHLLNDRSGGGPMQSEYGPSSHVPGPHSPTDLQPTPGGSHSSGAGQRLRTPYPGAEPITAPPPSGQPVYDEPTPAPASYRTAQVSPLTQSQKRRLRRRKQRQGVGESAPLVPAVPPVPPVPPYAAEVGGLSDAAGTSGVPTDLFVSPTDPNDPAWTHPTTSSCGAEVWVRFPNAGPYAVSFTCPLTPYPHPNQPHLIQLHPDQTDGVEVFLGWFDPDDVS